MSLDTRAKTPGPAEKVIENLTGLTINIKYLLVFNAEFIEQCERAVRFYHHPVEVFQNMLQSPRLLPRTSMP